MTKLELQEYVDGVGEIYMPPYNRVAFSHARLNPKDNVVIEQHTSVTCLEFFYSFANSLWSTKNKGQATHGSSWWNPKDTGYSDPDPKKFRILACYRNCKDAPTKQFVENVASILNVIEHTLDIEPTTTNVLDVPKRRVVMLTADRKIHNSCVSFSLWMNLVRSLMSYTEGDWLVHLHEKKSLFIELRDCLPVNHSYRPVWPQPLFDIWPKLITLKPNPWTGLRSVDYSNASSAGIGRFCNYTIFHGPAQNEWKKAHLLGPFFKKELWYE